VSGAVYAAEEESIVSLVSLVSQRSMAQRSVWTICSTELPMTALGEDIRMTAKPGSMIRIAGHIT
jgi:hypothetical protein